eukprot:9141583-Alexandrium_andersonii.AAC.1
MASVKRHCKQMAPPALACNLQVGHRTLGQPPAPDGFAMRLMTVPHPFGQPMRNCSRSGNTSCGRWVMMSHHGQATRRRRGARGSGARPDSQDAMR